MLNQKRSGSLARLKYLLAIPICGGLLCVSTLAFSKNYGWIMLTKQDTISKPPPPSPPQPKVTDVRLLPPPPPPNAKNVKFPAPATPSEVTKKGYKYAESGYLINGKTDFKVTIVEKDGIQTSYIKSLSSAEQIKMLRDKYGYSFPNMTIYSKLPKLPPPPPPPPAKLIDVKLLPPVAVADTVKHPRLPPPPAQEAPKASIDKRPPPPPPSALQLKPATTIKSGKAIVISIDTEAFNHTDWRDQTPVIVVNGSIYKLKEPLKKGQKLTVRADSTIAYAYSGEDLNKIVQKYGAAAQNGVIYAFGKTSVSIK